MRKRNFLLALGALAAFPAAALYDPKPIALLESAIGTWEGTLTYRDYQKPDRMVTLKAVMTVSLTAQDGRSSIAFEKVLEKRTDKYLLEIGPRSGSLAKHEHPVGEAAYLRSRYEFAKR